MIFMPSGESEATVMTESITKTRIRSTFFAPSGILVKERSARLTKAPIGEKMAIAGKMSAFILILPTSLPLLGK